MNVTDPQAELERFFATSTESLKSAILQVAAARIKGSMSPQRATERLTTELVELMTLAHMYGARRVLLEMDAATAGAKMADTLIPQIPFVEAIEDLVAREPRLGTDWLDVAKQYQEGHVFAAVRSSSLQITERVQKAISDLLEKGRSLDAASQVLQEMDDWSQAYADTVFRTNAATAYSNGRFEEAQKPLVKRAMPAFERFSAEDVDVRDHHAAAHGFIAGTDDEIWHERTPEGGPAGVPSGYGCRCALRMVSREELERRDLINPSGSVKRFFPPNWAAYHPDEGFEVKFRR